MEPCDLLAVELWLDRIEAELAAELPSHMRAFAAAYAHGERLPPAPAVLLRPGTLAAARASLVHPVLADRGVALLRLAVPVVIESDPAVVAAHAAPSWDALAALARARDAAAARLWPGVGAIELLRRLHGLHEVAGDADTPDEPAPVPGWSEPAPTPLDERAVGRVWQQLALRHGGDGRGATIASVAAARPRTFVIAPGREVVVVLPAALTTPAARFAVWHELGHALAALLVPAGISRVLDEAAAAYVARGIERDTAGAWYSPLAGAARVRRLAVARRLERLERALPDVTERRTEQPPWALWHDPGAQAAYVAAEAIADALEAELTPPTSGAFAAAIAAHGALLDRRAAATLSQP